MTDDASKQEGKTYIMVIPPSDDQLIGLSQDNQKKSEIIQAAKQVIENKKKD